MGLLEAFRDLCEIEGPLGEAATKVGEGLFECGHSIADALDGFADKLGEVQTELGGEDSGDYDWVVDRHDPEFEKTPGLRAMRDATDAIFNFSLAAETALNEAQGKVLEMTEKVLRK